MKWLLLVTRHRKETLILDLQKGAGVINQVGWKQLHNVFDLYISTQPWKAWSRSTIGVFDRDVCVCVCVLVRLIVCIQVCVPRQWK